jgi:hypothetical protein
MIIKVGDKVSLVKELRLQDRWSKEGSNYKARQGTVVEVPVGGTRVRVLWMHPNGLPDKRTWVSVGTLKVLEAVSSSEVIA